MNRLLAASVGWVNALMAWLLVALGAAVGFLNAGEFHWTPVLGALVGGFIGFILAFYVCGVLSLFVEIRKELIKIGAMLNQERVSGREVAERTSGSRDPHLQ